MKLFGITLLAANLLWMALASPTPAAAHSLLDARNNGNGNGNGGGGKTYSRLNKDDAVLLVIDHQTGLTSLVRDMEPSDFKTHVVGFADIGKFFGLPTILTTSRDDGPNGPMIPEILGMFPNTTIIRRPGQINAWDNEDFVNAVKATGRKQLIVSGIVTEVCVAFLSLSAIEAGYEVFVVTDASGTFNPIARESSWLRMQAAGVQLLTFFSAACELARDWRSDLQGLTDFFMAHIPEYATVIDSFQGAVATVQGN